jgi:hypothetical protein
MAGGCSSSSQSISRRKDGRDTNTYKDIEFTNQFDKNGKDIRPSKIQFYLETDASKAGWGANFHGIKTGGRWTGKESLDHSSNFTSF